MASPADTSKGKLDGSVLVAGLGIAAAGGVTGGLVGALHGAASAETPSAKVGRRLSEAAAQLRLQDAFRESVVQAASRRTELTFVDLPSASAPDTVDRILEVALHRIELRRAGSGPGLPVALVVSARARFLRAVDGRELYWYVTTHRTDSRPYAEWAADGARHFRESLARTSASMAEKVVDVIVVQSRPPSPAPSSYAACRNRHLGFRAGWRDRLPEYRACLAN